MNIYIYVVYVFVLVCLYIVIVYLCLVYFVLAVSAICRGLCFACFRPVKLQARRVYIATNNEPNLQNRWCKWHVTSPLPVTKHMKHTETGTSPRFLHMASTLLLAATSFLGKTRDTRALCWNSCTVREGVVGNSALHIMQCSCLAGCIALMTSLLNPRDGTSICQGN